MQRMCQWSNEQCATNQKSQSLFTLPVLRCQRITTIAIYLIRFVLLFISVKNVLHTGHSYTCRSSGKHLQSSLVKRTGFVASYLSLSQPTPPKTEGFACNLPHPYDGFSLNELSLKQGRLYIEESCHDTRCFPNVCSICGNLTKWWLNVFSSRCWQ